MTNSKVNICCVQRKCNTLNPLSAKVCSNCKTPIIKRYLWALGDEVRKYDLGDIIGDRYLLQHDRILLDTKPSTIPDFPEEIPKDIQVYLKLFAYRLHVPQVYGYIEEKKPIWLLEYSSININDEGELTYFNLFPSLSESWKTMTPLRQLNLLWQIIQLWKPLSQQKVLSSLLNEDYLRVNGPLVQLLELQSDEEENINLKELGKLWLKLSVKCDQSIRKIVEKISLCMRRELIIDPQIILNILDQVIYHYTKNSFDYEYKIISATHRGRKRNNNEDACYPPPKTLKEVFQGFDTLTIVCDGLGGQDRGEVASRLAINIMKEELFESYREQTLINKKKKAWSPLIDNDKIINAIYAANDEICRQNNYENRERRSRMGTTVVTSLAIDHEVYLGHVGDSRIYWIVDNNCYQVTVDDDLASREVRLGYAFYRDMIKSSRMGALLQALGTNESQSLHPNIQRFILDQDCVFLLCSDGLSDFDRVEQYWKNEILPILNNGTNLVQASKVLLNIGIKKNGHDNVTLALVYCKITPKEHKPENLETENLEDKNNIENENVESILSWEKIQELIPNVPDLEEIERKTTTETEKEIAEKPKNTKIVSILLLLLISIGLGSLLIIKWDLIKKYFNFTIELFQSSQKIDENIYSRKQKSGIRIQ